MHCNMAMSESSLLSDHIPKFFDLFLFLDGPDLPNAVAQDNGEATPIANSAPLDRNLSNKHWQSLCSYGMIVICFGAIIFALLAVIAAIMISTTSFQCLLNRNSFMCTLEKMLSDGAGITLNSDSEKAPHVSLKSPSFSEFH